MQYSSIKKYNVNRQTITELGKFTLLWNIFEKEYFDKKCKACKVKNYKYPISKNLEKKCNEFINVLHSYLGTCKNTINREIIKETLFDNSDEYHVEIENVLKNDCFGQDLIIGTVFILLRIRNNLFHGIKQCLTINNQLQLFNSANIVLNTLIEKRGVYGK